VHLNLKNLTIDGKNSNNFPENGDRKASSSGGATTLGDGRQFQAV